MWFDFGRNEGFPTQYDAHNTPVTVDVLDAGLFVAAAFLFICFTVSFTTTKFQQNASFYIRITLSLFIGLSIILGNFGQEWEVGEIHTKTPYRSGLSEEINATIGLKIGLRSINVTLKQTDKSEHTKGEIIDYNERFSWTWDQGRFGFGIYAGRLQREFRAAQYRGVPNPILWIVDYFVIDGEGFRFGRFYRTAGWYSHIALWSAFPCWILANIFFQSILYHGVFYLGLSGVLQLVANLIWISVRNPVPLTIPFEDAVLKTKFGPHFWLTFVTGLMSVSLSFLILIIERVNAAAVYRFFALDPFSVYEEDYQVAESITLRQKRNAEPSTKDQNDSNLESMEELEDGNAAKFNRFSKPILTKRHFMAPRIKKMKHYDDMQPIYENYQ